MKASPDLNDTLRTEGEAAVRNRLDNARRYQGNGPDADANTLPPLTLAEWLVRDLPEPDHLLGGLLSTPLRVLLAGPTGLGKTMLGLAAAMAMAEGKPFLHWKAGRKCRVLYVDGEISHRRRNETAFEGCCRASQGSARWPFRSVQGRFPGYAATEYARRAEVV